MAVSSRHNGWRDDANNSRLDMYYRGTRIGHLDACGLNIASGGLCVTGATTFNCNVTLTGSETKVTTCSGLVICNSGSYLKFNGGGEMRVDHCATFCNYLRILDNCASDIFVASACSEPCCAPKGVVWAWNGSACATAPCGSAFLMITDDGCV